VYEVGNVRSRDPKSRSRMEVEVEHESWDCRTRLSMEVVV
jgi:hypothetical protein